MFNIFKLISGAHTKQDIDEAIQELERELMTAQQRATYLQELLDAKVSSAPCSIVFEHAIAIERLLHNNKLATNVTFRFPSKLHLNGKVKTYDLTEQVYVTSDEEHDRLVAEFNRYFNKA